MKLTFKNKFIYFVVFIDMYFFFLIIMRNNLYLNDGNYIPKREYDSVQQLFEDKQKLIFHSNSYILRPLALTASRKP